jgi:hypothetical protein
MLRFDIARDLRLGVELGCKGVYFGLELFSHFRFPLMASHRMMKLRRRDRDDLAGGATGA